MAVEVLTRKLSKEVQRTPHFSRKIKPTELSPTRIEETDELQNFINEFSQILTPKKEEAEQFLLGANYAKGVVNQFYEGENKVSSSTLAVFIAEMMRSGRSDEYQHASYFGQASIAESFDFNKVIEKRMGKKLLLNTIPFSSLKDHELAGHFRIFENDFTKLGAFTVLHLHEKENTKTSAQPIELRQLQPYLLQSAS